MGRNLCRKDVFAWSQRSWRGNLISTSKCTNIFKNLPFERKRPASIVKLYESKLA